MCDVPSFVGMLKGFVSPALLVASCLFGGKEALTALKVVCILLYALGEVLINVGEVSFSSDCLRMASVAVACTTGKYFMIEKVMQCQLARLKKYDLVDEVEADRLLPSNNDTVEMAELHSESGGDVADAAEMESMPALLAFAYILPLQIGIGSLVFLAQEFEDVMFNANGANYAAVSRLAQNAVYAGIYWSEIHLVGEFSSLYMMVFGAVRNVITLALSRVVLKYQLTMLGWVGYAIAIADVSGFQYARKFDAPKV